MNEHEPETDPTVDPEQEAHVRSLLGEVGAQHEPIPDDVSARLDETLAMLRTERAQSGEPADVVPLRRRWLPRAAGAAAAVIVLGVGGVAAVRLGTDGSEDTAASRGAASGETRLSQAPSDAPVPSAGAGVTPGSKSRALRESAEAVRTLPALTTASFHADVAGLLRTDTGVVTPDERSTDQSGAESGSTSEEPSAPQQSKTDALLTRACPGPAVTDGAAANPVRVDGSLAVLLVHPEKDGEQLVEAWTCDGDRRLGSTQLTGADVTP
jgi:hypothetical protein